MHTSLAKKLYTLRHNQQLKQQTVAQLAGITQATLSRIESGLTKNPSLIKLQKLARIFGVSVDFLLEEHPNCPRGHLSQRAEVLIEYYSRCSEETQECIDNIVHTLVRHELHTK